MGNSLSAWADKIKEICQAMKALPTGGAFRELGREKVAELQRLVLIVGELSEKGGVFEAGDKED